MAEKLTPYPWPRTDESPPPDIWATLVGLLESDGGVRRRAILPNFYPHLVLRGSGVFRCPAGQWEIRTGDVFCLWPGIEHDFQEDPDDPWHFYWMRFEGRRAQTVLRDLGLAPDRRVIRPADAALAAARFQALHAYYKPREAQDKYHAHALLYELLSALQPDRANATSDSSAQLVGQASALAEDLLNTGIDVTGLARRLGVTRQKLFKAFRQRMDVTPVAYLQSLRMQRAKQLLASTDMKIRAVAAACGYANEKYFYRRFRERNGLTPAGYRRRYSRPEASNRVT